MNQRWTMHVKNFGKIREANIEISPLMLFVGDNNSGKSYLMSLLWGLLTVGKDIFPFKESGSESYKDCEVWLVGNFGRDVEITKQETGLFLQWFNELLDKEKRSLVKKVFNHSVEIGKMEIIDYSRKIPLKIKWVKGAERFSTTENVIKFPAKDNYSRQECARMLTYICWNLFMQGIAAPLFTPVVKGKRIGEPVYLPASRTGFMLTYETLVESALEGFFANEAEESVNSRLTLPYTDFLKMIIRFDSSETGRYADIGSFIEDSILAGKMIAHKTTTTKIRYIPKGLKRELPLHISSSVVSELSPLALLLKSAIRFNLLIIEEPEAHLHPKLQVLVAQAIIRLINSGMPVWVTTHSDTILQHINNMIKLNNHSQKGELMGRYNYQDIDLLSDRDVAMYQFDIIDQKTQISKLQSEKYGFVVLTFNEALHELAEETYHMQEED